MTTTQTDPKVQQWAHLAQQLRVDSIKEQEEQALKELNYVRSQTFPVQKPENLQPAKAPAKKPVALPTYAGTEAIATRKAYGDALRALGAANPDVVAMDGEVSNSTYAEEFARAYPDRFFEQYIAEQQLVSTAVGMLQDERSLSEETSMSVQPGFTGTYHLPAKEPTQNASFFPAL